MSRHPDKDMQKSYKSFDTTVKLCKFEEDFDLYRSDTIQKTCKTEAAFNAIIESERAGSSISSE